MAKPDGLVVDNQQEVHLPGCHTKGELGWNMTPKYGHLSYPSFHMI